MFQSKNPYRNGFFADYPAKSPPTDIARSSVTPDQLTVDPLALFKANQKNNIRLKNIDLSQPFEAYTITEMERLTTDDNQDKLTTRLVNELSRINPNSTLYIARVRIPKLHDGAIPDPLLATSATTSGATATKSIDQDILCLHPVAYYFCPTDQGEANASKKPENIPVTSRVRVKTDVNLSYFEIVEIIADVPIEDGIAKSGTDSGSATPKMNRSRPAATSPTGGTDKTNPYYSECLESTGSFRSVDEEPIKDLYNVVQDFFPDNFKLPLPENRIDNGNPHSISSPSCKRYERGVLKEHPGLDIPCATGTPVYAVAPGEVFYKVSSSTAGYYIEIKHPPTTGVELAANDDVLITRYMHLSEASNLGIGNHVSAGDQIGLSGDTGKSSGPHLHYELRMYKNNIKSIGIGTPAITFSGFVKDQATSKRITDPYTTKYKSEQ